MFNDDTSTLLSLVQLGLIWLLLGICLTKILNESRRLDINPVLAWVPFANIWVIAQIGRTTFWSILWKAILMGFIASVVFGVIAASLRSYSLLFVGQIIAGMVGTYFLWKPAAEQGRFPNAGTLAALAGLPVINVFVMIHIAWKGDWT